MSEKRRYVQVGLGGRSELYFQAIIKRFSDRHEIVGFCDINPGRLQYRMNEAVAMGGNLRIYLATDFESMVSELCPDCVIVTTMDSTHDQYIIRAMELGCDVITEKPMTIDEARCRRILETQRKTGRQCTVTFNYRYSPSRLQLKSMLMSGLIGEVYSVDFHWMLDLYHGADYFRRWHRHRANSGSLLVHKATHHFDLMNWWLATEPVEVFATGRRAFYLPKTAEAMGLEGRSERCLDCSKKSDCPFYLDLAGNASLRKLYLECESHDGYFRDRCVFSELIDIEDSIQVAVEYASGVRMSYSLNAFCPWEGYTITFNGSKGRIEHMCQESVYINADGTVPGQIKPEGTWTKVYPHRGNPYEVEIDMGIGGHGGGDDRMLEDIFEPLETPDPYHRAADQRSGAWSILTGIAANHSLSKKRPIRVSDLVSGF